MRHRRGWMGEELNSRAVELLARVLSWRIEGLKLRTFLEDRGAVDLHEGLVAVFIFLAVTHDGEVSSSAS